MKIFDECGNFLGDFVESTSDAISCAKDTVCDLASVSIVLGIIGFILAPGITLAIIPILFIFHLFIAVIKTTINIVWWVILLIIGGVWWVIRLPFTLVFLKRFPEF